MGICADRVRAPEKNLFDLWSVNEDSLYQEEVLIQEEVSYANSAW